MASLTRRAFLHTGSVAALLGPSLAMADAPATLVAREGRAQLAPLDYGPTRIWGYGGTVPGETLRLAQGARLRRTLVNDLPQATTIHWHGLRLPNAMDGVGYMTQDPVEPGASFDYDFVLPDAGTYWYHPHQRTYEQMARGLYGALIVEEPEGAPDIDADEVMLLDDWRLTEEAQIADGFGNLHDSSHAGRIGNWITINGRGEFSRPVQRYSRLRLRLVNVANARIFSLSLRDFDAHLVALDGMPLDTPRLVEQLVLAPAQRADLLVDVIAEDGAEALLVSRERESTFALASFPVRGQSRPSLRPSPSALPRNPVPTLGPLNDARAVSLRMEGGAMGGLREARLNGQMTGLRDLAQEHGKVWAFNGHVDMQEAPLIEAARGETIRIDMVNDTAWPHGMHLHGHHFRQINDQGPVGPLRDTLLMDRQSSASIAFVADNPGDWLLHCHMLEHSAAGMMTWIRVL